MKFLCVSCDEAMKLQETKGPEEGSLTVVFGCPNCSRQVALLTNAMETQMVRSLDVRIGSQQAPSDPMAFVRSSLAVKREEVPAGAEPSSGGSGCPFTSAANAAFERQGPPRGAIWSEEAAERLNNIPSIVRSWAQKGIEEYAREKGYEKITVEVMDEVKQRFGM
jgi:hypothetical protein